MKMKKYIKLSEQDFELFCYSVFLNGRNFGEMENGKPFDGYDVRKEIEFKKAMQKAAIIIYPEAANKP